MGDYERIKKPPIENHDDWSSSGRTVEPGWEKAMSASATRDASSPIPGSWQSPSGAVASDFNTTILGREYGCPSCDTAGNPGNESDRERGSRGGHR